MYKYLIFGKCLPLSLKTSAQFINNFINWTQKAQLPSWFSYTPILPSLYEHILLYKIFTSIVLLEIQQKKDFLLRFLFIYLFRYRVVIFPIRIRPPQIRGKDILKLVAKVLSNTIVIAENSTACEGTLNPFQQPIE